LKSILGLNAYHGDASACILLDGQLVAAVEEERFKRVKHWAGFPVESIKYCLAQAELTIDRLDMVAINSDSMVNLGKKIRYLISGRPGLSLMVEKFHNRSRRASIERQLACIFPNRPLRAKKIAVEHHLAHLASAYYVSPFDEAVAVSVDGFGDFSSGAWGIGQGKELKVDQYVHFPHSLGVFYQAMTQYLGFPRYGDEYKLMGLASYGTPRFRKEVGQLVQQGNDGAYALALRYFRHQRHEIGFEWSDGEPEVSPLYDREAMEELLGPHRGPGQELTQRHMDIACSVQTVYEKAFFRLLNAVYEHYQVKDLALAGGCAMNSVANGRITENTPFRQVYVQPAAGDAGGALGAAFAAWHQTDSLAVRCQMSHAQLGPGFDRDYIRTLMRSKHARLGAVGCSIDEISDESALCERVSGAIVDGKVVGWFQGRMEWGPRALGNRSILCDPRRADMKDVLNAKIKRRESFRPFAPSILREEMGVWFMRDDDVPFMTKVYSIRPEKRSEIPAVTHVDGSGRLQTVTEDENPRYYRLIAAFEKRTGVPILLNTSFNENEPIVCRPEEALDCFLRTDMDVLVMEGFVITRAR
jgi:carbamoyltransferase